MLGISVVLTDRPIKGVGLLAHPVAEVFDDRLQHVRVGQAQLRAKVTVGLHADPFAVDQGVIFRMFRKIPVGRQQLRERMHPHAPVGFHVIELMPIRIERIVGHFVKDVPVEVDRHLAVGDPGCDRHLRERRIFEHGRRITAVTEVFVEKRINAVQHPLFAAAADRERFAVGADHEPVLLQAGSIGGGIRPRRIADHDLPRRRTAGVGTDGQFDRRTQREQPPELVGRFFLDRGGFFGNDNYITALTVRGERQSAGADETGSGRQQAKDKQNIFHSGKG